MNNPLAVVSGRSQLLMNQMDNEEFRSALAVIHEQAHRCSQIVSDLMEFAKPAAPKPRSIDLAGLLMGLRETWLATYRLEDRSDRGENYRTHRPRCTPMRPNWPKRSRKWCPMR